MPETSVQHRLEIVWQSIDEALGDEITGLWEMHGALPSVEAARRRLPEVVMIARDDNGGLAAVSSVQVRRHPPLGHRFYTFRCFVAPAHRRSLLAARLICGAFDFFEARFLEGTDPDIIGMMTEVENVELNRAHNLAVWPHSRFVFVGYDRLGRHVRVRYFEGARVTSRI